MISSSSNSSAYISNKGFIKPWKSEMAANPKTSLKQKKEKKKKEQKKDNKKSKFQFLTPKSRNQFVNEYLQNYPQIPNVVFLLKGESAQQSGATGEAAQLILLRGRKCINIQFRVFLSANAEIRASNNLASMSIEPILI